MVNQISNLQIQAMANKPNIASLADKFSQYFVTAVLFISVLTYVVWLQIDDSQALWITISVLIATCPCALGLATPSALSCAIAHLNSKGLLLKRSDALEKLTKVDWVGLDKTGTLTKGEFNLVQCINLADVDTSSITQLAASLEQYSSHPISKAFSKDEAVFTVNNFETFMGQGIKGKINNIEYKIGAKHFMDFPIPDEMPVCNVYLQSQDKLLAGFILKDELRPNSVDFVNRLKDKTVNLISGDQTKTVNEVANQLNIPHSFAEKTPQDKLQLVQQAQSNGHTVLMVGDGINDGPVLAQSDVSITLGASSDLAKSSADVILLDNTLDKLNLLFQIAQRCRKKIIQNIGWAISYNLLVLPLAFMGYLSPWMAVIGMSLSSLIVVVNSIRLLK